MKDRYDWLVIGAGPAGQKAAIQAAKAGCTVAIVERGRQVGGECVHRGTIPSKALRETALQVARMRLGPIDVDLPQTIPLSLLLSRVARIVEAHVEFQLDQLERNGVEVFHGKGRFLGPHQVEIRRTNGDRDVVAADRFVVATGSVPRRPSGLQVDHEFVLDSDSILSQPYLPERLLVLGAGVIACEYATVFKHLGVEVTVVDRGSRPLSFMDTQLSHRLLESFIGPGCRYLPGDEVVQIDRGMVDVRAKLSGGEIIEADKVLVALGRSANVAKLGLETMGITLTRRGHVEVDDQYRTSVPHIFAVGDAIGFPALAATSMEQGRRVVRLALGLPVTDPDHACPVGIYTIPELASVGVTEDRAKALHKTIRVGLCDFSEVARGQISGQRGLLKLIASGDGERLLGVHAVGDGATELVHLGQLALIGGLPPQVFVDNTFNFPTLAEAYRIAALALDAPGAIQ